MEKEAYQLLIEGKNQEALSILEEIVSSSPTESSLFNYALALYRLERLEEALDAVNRLLGLNPSHRKGLFLKGVICRRLGDMECAREALSLGGFEELEKLIPEPVKRSEPEEEIPEEDLIVLHEEEEKEEAPEEAAPEESVSEEPAVTTEESASTPLTTVRVRIEGTLKVASENFIAFITSTGSLEEQTGEYICKGNGEVILTPEQLEGEIRQDAGEGQLLIDETDERLVIKVNPDEKVFYKESYKVSWLKMQK